MENASKRRHRLPVVAVLTAVMLLLTAGASSGAAMSTPEAVPVRYKAVPAAVKNQAGSAERAEKAQALPPEEEPETPPSPLPETAAVEDAYFEDAIFLGDSRTEGLFLYSGLKTGHFYTSVGATVESVFTKKNFALEDGTKVPILDAMKDQACDKVYIMLGINELGWSKTKTYHDQYAKLIDRVREDHPEAKIVLQSIPPVSAKQEAKKTYVNNQRITAYNEVIQTLAEEKGCYFLDVAACLTGKDGLLPKDLNFDGIHLNPAGCKVWLTCLRTHSLEDDAIATALEAAKA